LASITCAGPAISDALMAPMKTILENAGYEFNKKYVSNDGTGLDARTGLEVDLLDAGIVDSYASIETAIKNASSIACSYLRAYVLINQNIKEGN
jgi:chaperonin GroEL (HSP60 family)